MDIFKNKLVDDISDFHPTERKKNWSFEVLSHFGEVGAIIKSVIMGVSFTSLTEEVYGFNSIRSGLIKEFTDLSYDSFMNILNHYSGYYNVFIKEFIESVLKKSFIKRDYRKLLEINNTLNREYIKIIHEKNNRYDSNALQILGFFPKDNRWKDFGYFPRDLSSFIFTEFGLQNSLLIGFEKKGERNLILTILCNKNGFANKIIEDKFVENKKEFEFLDLRKLREKLSVQGG